MMTMSTEKLQHALYSHVCAANAVNPDFRFANNAVRSDARSANVLINLDVHSTNAITNPDGCCTPGQCSKSRYDMCCQHM